MAAEPVILARPLLNGCEQLHQCVGRPNLCIMQPMPADRRLRKPWPSSSGVEKTVQIRPPGIYRDRRDR